MKNRAFHHRLKFAMAGIVTVWRRERSFRTQVAVAFAALLALMVLRPGFLWVAVVVLSVALVLGLELLNSALEALIDHLHPEIAPAVKIAKDAAAGAVLLASMAAAIVGGCMLISLFRGSL
jgi:undecaprenol kinase